MDEYAVLVDEAVRVALGLDAPSWVDGEEWIEPWRPEAEAWMETLGAAPTLNWYGERCVTVPTPGHWCDAECAACGGCERCELTEAGRSPSAE